MTLFTDAPVCKEGKSEVVVGALKQETVSLVCSVESHPVPLTFHWTFNNSGELVEVPQSRYSHVPAPGTPSVADSLKEYQQFHGSRLNYTPATEMDYGTVACWASNQVGKQRTPCLFQASTFPSTSFRFFTYSHTYAASEGDVQFRISRAFKLKYAANRFY